MKKYSIEPELIFENRLKNTPSFSQAIGADDLPRLICPLWKIYTDQRSRDVSLLSALTAFSGLFDKVSVEHAEQQSGINLYLNVVAPAASNKSAMISGKSISKLIVEMERNEGLLALEAYNESKKEEGSATGEPKPAVPELLMSADLTQAGLVNRLKNNSGRGFIFDSEIDTLANNINRQWESISPIIRKNFDNASIQQDRKSSNIIIDRSSFSMALSGTPGQIKKLYPSAENGIVSRMMLYLYEDENQWNKKIFKGSDGTRMRTYDEMSVEALMFYKKYRDRYIDFKWSDDAADLLNQLFDGLLNTYSQQLRPAAAMIKRLGVIASKMGATIKLLRLHDNAIVKSDADTFVIDVKDCKLVLEIVSCLFEHSLLLLTNLNDDEELSRTKFNKVKMFGSLPDSFKTSDAIQVAKELHISERTVRRYLVEWQERRTIVSTGHGEYEKVK